MNKLPLGCRSCGHFGAPECQVETGHGKLCNSYLSWSVHWMQEMATIERALRNTYIAAAFFAVLAAAAVILPTALA